MKKQSVVVFCILWITVVMPALFIIGLYFKPWVFFLAVGLLLCGIIGYHIIHKSQISGSDSGPLQNPLFETQCQNPVFDHSLNTSSHDTTHGYSYTEEYTDRQRSCGFSKNLI